MKANDLTEQQKTTDDVIEIGEILRRLPHRYPFLLIDRAVDYVPNKSIRGIKNVTINEPFFPGPLPRRAGDARRAADRGAWRRPAPC